MAKTYFDEQHIKKWFVSEQQAKKVYHDEKLSMICWDSAMDTKQNKVILYIRACTGVENVDFWTWRIVPEINHRRT